MDDDSPKGKQKQCPKYCNIKSWFSVCLLIFYELFMNNGLTKKITGLSAQDIDEYDNLKKDCR